MCGYLKELGKMLLNLDTRHPGSTAIVDNQGHRVTYGVLRAFCNDLFKQINKRMLYFILCENSVGALLGYIAGLAMNKVPLMLDSSIDRNILDNLIQTYQPEYIWMPQKKANEFRFQRIYSQYEYVLVSTNLKSPELYRNLSLLLTTSGSTGSPKLVRHSYLNIEANAKNVAAAFNINEQERGMVSLPLQFTQGLNVATSHLYAGATVLLSTDSLTQKEFWDFFKEQKATSLTGVPYSYEILEKLRFFNMRLPHLKTINQGGGRLTNDLFKKCAQYATDTGRRFIASYGSTETTARMACLPFELAAEKCGSIGKAIPEGQISLVSDEGERIDKVGEVGEIIYSGPNVTLGYAQCSDDLIKGDERKGIYQTGDLAWCDEDGCFYIVGRKKRFLKLYGYRIGLDETERMIKNEFSLECACIGNDKKMDIFITLPEMKQVVHRFITRKTGINMYAFQVHAISEIPKNATGKIQYSFLQKQTT